MRYDPPVHEVIDSRSLLVAEPRFGVLWLAQGLAQTAQNALLFTLLVVVLEITGSSTQTGLLVLSFILPSIPLGVAVGVLLDRWQKGPVLVVTSLLRSGGCILYLFFHGNEWAIYGISLGFATSGMFFNPAVVALIPSLVPREKLVNANSLYNFTLTGSQLLGMVFLASLVLKSFGGQGEEVMFIIAAVMFVIAAGLGLGLSGVREGATPMPQGALFGAIPKEFRESWRALTSDLASMLALVQLVMGSSLVLLFAILIPRYMKDILGIGADNAAFIFAPTGVGALVGLRFLPWATRRFGKNQVVVLGLLGLSVCILLLALVHPLADLFRRTGPLNPEERLAGLSLLQALTMSIAGPLGFAYALLSAPAQTVLHERAPAEMRGRIFATQVVSANFLSLLPLLFIGGLIDLLEGVTELPGIAIVLALISVATAGLAGVSARVGGIAEREEELMRQKVSSSVDRHRGLG